MKTYSTSAITEYISADAETDYSFSGFKNTYTFLYYDSNLNYIGYDQGSSVYGSITTPVGCAYLRLTVIEWLGTETIVKTSDTITTPIPYSYCILTNPDTSLDNYVKSLISQYSGNSLAGEKWLVCGDSITYYTVNNKNYQSIIATDNSMNYEVMARAGWTVYDVTNGLINMTNGVTPIGEYNHDIVTVFIGTNNRTTTLGTINDASAFGSENTFYAQFKYLVDWLQRNFTHQRVGIITPYLLSSGGLSKPVRDAIIEVCALYNVRYFDSFVNFASLDRITDVGDALYRTVLGDGLHPSELGYIILARKLEDWMKSL